MEGTQSTSDVSHIGSESSAEIVDVEPLRDFEHDKYAIQGFVVDYFTYRLQLKDFEWAERPVLPYENLAEYEAMRDVALIFERRHSDELNRMVDQLLSDKYLSFQRYVEVVENFGRNDDESPAHMSYGRLVALISFGGVMVCRLAEEHMRSEISAVALYTSKFLEKRIQLSWAQDDRSWAKFVECAEMIKRRDSVRQREREECARARVRRWSWIGLATVGVVGIGAFTLTRAVLSR
ncbi:Apoptosis regulator ced-9 [Toxocara canis]|nr:Apoptosis regulator ced-9 [Toxocara canis]